MVKKISFEWNDYVISSTDALEPGSKWLNGPLIHVENKSGGQGLKTTPLELHELLEKLKEFSGLLTVFYTLNIQEVEEDGQ